MFLWVLLIVVLGGGFCHTDCQMDLLGECYHLPKEYNNKHPGEGGVQTACDDTQVCLEKLRLPPPSPCLFYTHCSDNQAVLTMPSNLAILYKVYEFSFKFNKRLAQLVRSLTANQKVPGSIPDLVEG